MATTMAPGAWTAVQADETSDALIAAMGLGGVEYLFFTSGSEIMFFQEAIAKAKAQGKPTPKLITMTHEHPSLNAAIGYGMVTGRAAATAAHVDVGTQNYGGAVHTAFRGGVPVLITAGGPPTAYPDSMRGARDGAHFWLQQGFDQNGIVRQYVKWDHKLTSQDNPGLMVSRALQVAQSEPQGPVYLSLPREVAMSPIDGARFPTVEQLGLAQPAAPDPDAIRQAAAWLVQARNPAVVVSRSGRNPEAVTALVALCELLGLPVVEAAWRTYQSFLFDHPLYQGPMSLKDCDMVLVLDSDIPWLPGPNAPPADAKVVVVDVDPIKPAIPTYEFTANLRITSDALLGIRALQAAAEGQIGSGERQRFADRAARWGDVSRERRQKAVQEAQGAASKTPVDALWVAYQLSEVMDDNCVLMDETLVSAPVWRFVKGSTPRSYFKNPGSSGGWGPGAALGAKLAMPQKDVIMTSGDGFYMYAVANPAIWAAKQYGAPFMAVVFQNRSYSTGTRATVGYYPEGYSARSGLEGGYFDPPIDFAKEAEAAGAYGENVRDPAEVGPALRRGLQQIRNGTPAVISVWLPKLVSGD
ncbi:MAG TPA: thiamine pyrophosphate-requiring protein [Chloroflexota bacterium]|nr:thiamine pyrophosphate-requiring protein [Chloroflexota bacterium]